LHGLPTTREAGGFLKESSPISIGEANEALSLIHMFFSIYSLYAVRKKRVELAV
jgi:hypothetical protein